MINWVQEIAGWAPIAFAWLLTAAVGTTIYFFPIARHAQLHRVFAVG